MRVIDCVRFRLATRLAPVFRGVVTNLLRNPKVSIQTAKAIGGHIDRRMIDRYTHIHLTAKREAIAALVNNHEHRESGNALSTPNVNMNTEGRNPAITWRF